MFLDRSIAEFPPGSGVPKIFTMGQLGLLDENGAWDEVQFLRMMDTLDAMYANWEKLPAANIGLLVLILRGDVGVDGKIIGEAVPIGPFLPGLSAEEMKTAHRIIATMLLPGMQAENLFPAGSITQNQIDHIEKCGRWLLPKGEKPLRGLKAVHHLAKLPAGIYADPALYGRRRAKRTGPNRQSGNSPSSIKISRRKSPKLGLQHGSGAVDPRYISLRLKRRCCSSIITCRRSRTMSACALL